jgi:hypothetical protein
MHVILSGAATDLSVAAPPIRMLLSLLRDTG